MPQKRANGRLSYVILNVVKNPPFVILNVVKNPPFVILNVVKNPQENTFDSAQYDNCPIPSF